MNTDSSIVQNTQTNVVVPGGLNLTPLIFNFDLSDFGSAYNQHQFPTPLGFEDVRSEPGYIQDRINYNNRMTRFSGTDKMIERTENSTDVTEYQKGSIKALTSDVDIEFRNLHIDNNTPLPKAPRAPRINQNDNFPRYFTRDRESSPVRDESLPQRQRSENYNVFGSFGSFGSFGGNQS